MKKRNMALMAAVALLAFTGCEKENEQGVPTDFTVVLESGVSNGAKVTINDVRKPCWEVGDAIRVNASTDGAITSVNSSNPTVAYITATVGDAPYYAVYPASLVTAEGGVTASPDINLPRVQIYKKNTAGVQTVEAPMAAYNPSHKVLQFRNLCSVVKITVTNDKDWDMIVDSIHIESLNKSLCGQMQLLSLDDQNTIESTTPYLKVLNANAATDPDRANGRLLGRQALEAAKRIVSLAKAGNTSIGEAVDINGTKDFYMYLPAMDNSQLTIRVFTHPDWTDDGWSEAENQKVHIVYSRTTSSVTLARNQFLAIPYTLSDANPTFTSMKAFSVADGTQVCFSRGNVQYYTTATSGSRERSNTNVGTGNANYRFAPRQWSWLGQTSVSFMASSDWFIANPHASAGWREYFPWATGDNPVYFELNNASQHVVATITGGTYDWGYYFTNLMSSKYHGTSNRVWYTPTGSEYQYVLRGRNKVGKFAWATILSPKYGVVVDNGHGAQYNHIYGCILIPDNVSVTELMGGEDGVSTFKYDGFNDNGYLYRNDNVYTVDQFEYLEAKGCIFFPCIGAFVPTSPHVGNNTPIRNWTSNTAQGRYWASTSSTTQPNTQAKTLWLQSKDLGLSGNESENAYTSTNANYDDPCQYISCVRLVCPATTAYFWDPDQM